MTRVARLLVDDRRSATAAHPLHGRGPSGAPATILAALRMSPHAPLRRDVPADAPVAVRQAGFRCRRGYVPHAPLAAAGASAQLRRRRRATSPSIAAAPAAKAAFGEEARREAVRTPGAAAARSMRGPSGIWSATRFASRMARASGEVWAHAADEDDDAGEVVDPHHRISAMPKAWNASELAVALSRKVESCLRTSNSDGAQERAGPQRPAGDVRLREQAEEGEEEQRVGRQAQAQGQHPEEALRAPRPRSSHSMIGVSTLVATPDTATLATRTDAERQEGEHVAQLADEEARLLALGLLEDRHQRGAHAREPPQAGVEREQDADAEDPRRRGSAGCRAGPRSRRRRGPGRTELAASTSVSSASS